MYSERNKGNVVVCYPAIQGNGAKYIATNLAHYYKQKNPNNRVALVDFDFKNPYLAGKLSINDDIHGIDNLIDKIDGEFLDSKLFAENMIALKNGVDLLKGTKLFGNYHLITKTHVDKMIELLRELYDLVVVAVSNDSDNAGTVYGLFNADKILMVLKNNFANLKNMNRALKMVNNYKNDRSRVNAVFNMFSEASDLDFSAVIRENSVNVVGYVKYDESTIDNQDLYGGSITSKMFKSKNKGTEYDEIILSLE